jgi:hypothetical protein
MIVIMEIVKIKGIPLPSARFLTVEIRSLWALNIAPPLWDDAAVSEEYAQII